MEGTGCVDWLGEEGKGKGVAHFERDIGAQDRDAGCESANLHLGSYGNRYVSYLSMACPLLLI